MHDIKINEMSAHYIYFNVMHSDMRREEEVVCVCQKDRLYVGKAV